MGSCCSSTNQIGDSHTNNLIKRIQQDNQRIETIFSMLLENNNETNQQLLKVYQEGFDGFFKAIQSNSRAIYSGQSILNQDSLQIIKQDLICYYFNSQEVNWLMKFWQNLSEANQLAKRQLQISQIVKKVQQVAQDYHKNINKIHMRHYKIVKMAQKLFSLSSNKKNKINLNELKYDLFNQQQILIVSKIVKLCCQQDLNAFFFLSAYLKQCCLRIEKTNKFKIVDIEKRLSDILNFLRKQHPPNQNKLEDKIILDIEHDKKLQHSLKINLKQIEPLKRSEKLNHLIVQIAKAAKNNLSQFIQITKSPCQNNNGIQYKTGLKVKDENSKSSIDRVKEKLLSKKTYKKYHISQETQNLSQFLIKQSEHHDQNMAEILNLMNQQIQFTVSDMLRGKCMFVKITDIKNAAKAIAENSQKKGYKFQIDNRLSKPTTDLVFKIKIGDIITEFQLAYKFNVIKNEFNHKIFQLARSNFYSALSTLFIFDEKSVEFMNEFLYRITKLDKQKIEIRVKLNYNQKLQDIKVLRRQFETFWKDKKYIQSKQEEKNEQNKEILIKISKLMLDRKPNYNLVNTQKKKEQNLYLNGAFLENIYKNKKAIEMFRKAKKVIQCLSQLSKPQNELDKKLDWRLSTNLQKVGNLDESLQIYKNLLEKENQERRSLVFGSMGNVYKEQGNYAKALQAYKKSLQIRQKIKEQDDIHATLLNNIGLVYQGIGNYVESIKFLQKGLKIRKNINGQDSISFAQSLGNIGCLHFEKGNYQEALKYFEKSLKIKKNVNGEDSIQVSVQLNNIGNIFQSQGNYQEALKYYEKSLKIQKNVKGQDSINVADTLNNIGLVYNNQWNHAEALKFLEKSLEIRKNIKGQDSIDVAMSLLNIGNIYQSQGNYQEALKYYEKSLEIKKNVKGEDSIDVADTLNNIGLVYNNQENYAKALQSLQKCLKIRKNIKGQGSIAVAQTLSIIGSVYDEMGNYGEALKFYQRCLEINKNVKGEDSIDVAMVQNNIGIAYYKQGNYIQGQKFLQRSQKIVLYKLSQNHPLVIKISNNVKKLRLITGQ